MTVKLWRVGNMLFFSDKCSFFCCSQELTWSHSLSCAVFSFCSLCMSGVRKRCGQEEMTDLLSDNFPSRLPRSTSLFHQPWMSTLSSLVHWASQTLVFPLHFCHLMPSCLWMQETHKRVGSPLESTSFCSISRASRSRVDNCLLGESRSLGFSSVIIGLGSALCLYFTIHCSLDIWCLLFLHLTRGASCAYSQYILY